MKPVYIKTVVLAGILSLACTTKVSEWVLLNSVPDNYVLVYYHQANVSELARDQNKIIQGNIASANLQFRTLSKTGITKPYYALYYETRLFGQYSDYNELEGLSYSPLRSRIASGLMAGDLCVMLYLKTGNQEKDTRGSDILKRTVAASPFGEIIQIIELDRSSPEEKHLVSLLLNVEEDLKRINEPMLFGIFGRFRVLEPLLAKGISEENINLMIDFLTADCSCLIKDDLPGISILYDGKWDDPLPARVNKIIDENPFLEHH